MTDRNRDVLKVSLDAKTYREFLASVFGVLGEHSRTGAFNYSTFARKAGYKSRGFAQEVLSGRKRLTAQSHAKFEKALDLPARAQAIFKLLVEREEKIEGLSEKEISKRLAAARARIRAELASGSSEKEIASQVHRYRHVLTVYATLGNQEFGVTFDDIVRKTRLQTALVRQILDHLKATDVATEIDGRFRSINPMLVFQGFGTENPVRDSYLDTVSDLARVAKERFSDGDKAFIHSYVSVDPRRLGDLKKRLWEVVREFIDECDDDDGEVVAKFLVGFYV